METSYDSIINNLKNNEVNCDQADVDAMEKLGQDVADNIKDMVMNIDLTSAQYDLELL